MRHVSHGLGHGLRYLDIVGTWLKRNAALVAVSLLVPLVALGALAIPPRVVQGVAAPLWRALASPLGDVSTRHIPGLHGDPAPTPSESPHLFSAGTDVAVANVTGGLLGPNRRAGRQRPASDGLESAEEQRTKSPSGGAGATGDDAEPSEEGASGGEGDAGRDGGSGADDETGGGRADPPGGGGGNQPGRGNDDGCSAKPPRTAASRSREATATAEAATSVAEATAATAASAANLATGTAVTTATPITEAAAAAGAGTVGALSGAATGAVATIAAPRRR
jgi:hypothetical protein